MKFFNTNGIVINKRSVGEGDLGITIFTLAYGRLHLYIKGIRKSKKRDRNAVDVLSLSKFTLYKKNEKIIVSNFELEDPFLGIRSDMEKINISMYFLSVLNKVLVENQRKTSFYKNFVKTLKYLNILEDRKKKYLLICYFLNKIVDEEGIGFQIKEGNYLDIEGSRFSMERKSNSYYLNIEEKKIISILRRVGQNEKIEINELGSAIRVIKVLEKYINYHLHINLDFKQFLGEDIKDATNS